MAESLLQFVNSMAMTLSTDYTWGVKPMFRDLHAAEYFNILSRWPDSRTELADFERF